MTTRSILIGVSMFVLILIAGCGAAETTPTAEFHPTNPSSPPTDMPTLAPTATPLQSTSAPAATSTPTSIPSTPEPEPSPAPVSFVDSGQRLGSARSVDVSLGDLDGDGDLDALVANDGQAGGGNAVWLNDGRGVFAVSEQTPGSGTSVELGDLDGDGDLDAFVVSWNDDPSTVWLNDGSGSFADSGQALGSGGWFSVALGDLDGDGDLDAFAAQREANTIWLNDGNGVFTDSDQRLGEAITGGVGLGDLDGDGDLDALTGGWDEPARVWLNDGAGVFTDSGHDLSPAQIHIHGIALGDVDGDGDLDAFMAVASGDPNEVWLNNGDGSFSNSGQALHSSLAHAVSLGDLDGDGDLDAFTAHGDQWRGTENKVWLNDGAGHFADSGLHLGDTYSFGVALGDLDGDGDLDAFVANCELWRDSGGGTANEVWVNETISSSGCLIAFYSERDGNAEIYIMNADGSGQTRLTDNAADDMSPEWSPDGKRLVFMSDRDDPNPVRCFPHCNNEIYVMNADGSNQQRLTDVSAADYHPIWSPFGAQIAFVTKRDGNWEIYIMAADGSDQQRLTTTDDWEFFPVWSPDGTEIAFFACDPQCRPNRQDIYVMNSDGSNVRRLTDSPSTVDEDPAWSPDGKKIVFQSDRDGNFEIYAMNADGSDQQRLSNHRGDDYWPSWRPAPAATFSLEKSLQKFGAGTFQIGLGDLDGDGDLDAVFANPQQHKAKVWMNEGGQFTDSGQKLTQYGHGVGVADFDGDGDLDAFITCHYFVSPSKIYLNDGNGALQDTGQDLGDAGISGAELNLVDLDGDGDMDVHVMYYDPQGLPDKVYLNDGDGAFSDSGLALDEEVIAWGDLDADGDVDYLGKRYGEGYAVWLNDSSGQFSEGWQMEDEQAMDGGIALGDFDGDGDLDALIANGFRTGGSHPTLLLRNDGGGQFVDSGFRFNATMGADFAVGDLDGDGDLDVFVSNFDLPNEVWLNDGSGRFSDSGLRLGQERDTSTKPSLGDLDGDGDLDVFVGSLQRQPEIWFNATPTGE